MVAMKKILLFAIVATMFAACTKEVTEDITPIVIPNKLHVNIAEEESRIGLSNGKTVWNEGDKVSVFYKSNANQCWKFNGKTGDRSGTLSYVSGGTGTKTNKVVAIYPYNWSNDISGNLINTTIPQVQCSGQCIMVAISDDDELQFKHVFGWIKLSLTDNLERNVKYITFSGNNNEKLAGDCIIDAASQKLYMSGTSYTSTILNFWSVKLSKDTPIDFYIPVLPQVFTKGATINVIMTDDSSLELHFDEAFTISRNHIQPIKARDVISKNNIILYTTTSDSAIRITDGVDFGAKLISNTYISGIGGYLQFDGNISRIPQNAFDKRSLNSIALPANIIIEPNAFKEYKLLKSVKINGYIDIGDYAFNGCTDLAGITIPSGIIGANAFQDCTNLKSVNIGNSVTKIGSLAFDNCKNISDVYIEDIAKWCEIDCSSNPLRYGYLCLDYYDRKYNEIDLIIPDGVKSIRKYAFSSCRNIKSVTIPDSVTSIGSGAFENCQSLNSVTIGNAVNSIGDAAFYGCKMLSGVIIIPDSVESIGSQAFHGCVNLFGFIGKYASSDLRCLIINGKLVAFAPKGITEYDIPDGVTTIDECLFYDVEINKLTIPESVTYIRELAFYFSYKNNERIDIYCKPTTPPRIFNLWSPFLHYYIYVPQESVKAYKDDNWWNIDSISNYYVYINGTDFNQ